MKKAFLIPRSFAAVEKIADHSDAGRAIGTVLLEVRPEGRVRATGTDGHMVLRVERTAGAVSGFPGEDLEEAAVGTTATPEVGQLSAVAKGAKWRKGHPLAATAAGDVAVMFEDDRRPVLRATNLVVKSEVESMRAPADVWFPPIDCLMPKETPQAIVSLDPILVRTMMDAMIDLGVKEVRWEVRGHLDGVRMTAGGSEGESLEALVMPRRMGGAQEEEAAKISRRFEASEPAERDPSDPTDPRD